MFAHINGFLTINLRFQFRKAKKDLVPFDYETFFENLDCLGDRCCSIKKDTLKKEDDGVFILYS